MRLAEVLTGDHRTRYVVLDDHGCLVTLLVRYLKHLDQRGYAPNTLRSYGTSLMLFFEYLNQRDADFRQITLDTLDGFVSWLKWPYASTKVIPSYPVAPVQDRRIKELEQENQRLKEELKIALGKLYERL
ncbi:MAG: site-specific integrase [Ktedonobacteraceae bacterium]